MNTLPPDVQNLMDKLKIAEEIYIKAADRVHNEPMAKDMKNLADRKSMFLEDTSKLLKLDLDKYEVQWKERVKVELEKAVIEFDHIYIQMNEGLILSFCVKREEELIAMYQKVLKTRNITQSDELINELFLYQLNESILLLDELREKKERYNF